MKKKVLGFGYWVLGFGYWVLGVNSNYFFIIRCGRCLLPCGLYEKVTSKFTSAEPPRWAIGTGQLSRLRFRAGPIARRGGGMIPFSIFVVSVRTCPLYESLGMPNITFMIRCGRTRVPNPGPPVAVIKSASGTCLWLRCGVSDYRHAG